MSRLREQIEYLKEFMYGSAFMGGSFPGPEPGKLHSTSMLFPGVTDDEETGGEKKQEKPKPRKPGREKEEKRWRKR